MAESMSTRRASAKARKVKRPKRLTTVMRKNTDAQEPVDSIRYPEKYTIRTPVETHTHKHTHTHGGQIGKGRRCEKSAKMKSRKENITMIRA